MIAGMRLRAGRAGSGKGAGRMIAQAISTARAAGATGPILVRGDSAYGTRAVIGACVPQGPVLPGRDPERRSSAGDRGDPGDGVDPGGLSGGGARS